jgi:hypothetical protein
MNMGPVQLLVEELYAANRAQTASALEGLISTAEQLERVAEEYKERASGFSTLEWKSDEGDWVKIEGER